MSTKKKVFLGIGIFILFLVFVSSLSKEENKGASAVVVNEDTPKVELQSKGISSDVEIEVLECETTKIIGDNTYSKKESDGIFKVIKLKLTNNQKDAITIDSNSFKLIDDKNREFSYSTEGNSAKEKSFFLDKVNPGLSKEGFVVFDVPENATGLYLSATGGMTGKKINLKIE
jgi:hypothetical protein